MERKIAHVPYEKPHTDISALLLPWIEMRVAELKIGLDETILIIDLANFVMLILCIPKFCFSSSEMCI
jgi:hypothetical protein